MSRLSKADKDRALQNKEKAQLIGSYFNRMEEIITTHDAESLKADKIAELTMLIGKSMAMFSELTDDMNIYNLDQPKS